MRRVDGTVPGFPFGPGGGAGRWHWSGPARRIRQAASLALVGGILMLGGAATHARTGPVLPAEDARDVVGAEIGPPTRPIPGWTDFCRRMPAECAVDAREPTRIHLTVATWRTLRSVNARVNARVKPITDQAHWGVVDRWDFPDDGFGDCEDYQLLKRRMLAERGLPRRALLMTVVIDEINEGHAVLTVRTDRGDLILDNKTDAIRPWRRTGYSFVKRAGQDGPAWVALDKEGDGRGDGKGDGKGRDAGAQVASAEP